MISHLVSHTHTHTHTHTEYETITLPHARAVKYMHVCVEIIIHLVVDVFDSYLDKAQS